MVASSRPAPWDLAGACVVALVCRPAAADRLPEGLEPLGRWLVVVAACYSGSTVGPYLELAVGRPARLGRHPGLCVTTMVVSSAESRDGGRDNWGFPKTVGALGWSEGDGRPSLRWDDHDVVVAPRGRSGAGVPVAAPLRALQRRADGLVVVPATVRGRARPARVGITAPTGTPLADLDGDHPGLVVSRLRLTVGAARPLHDQPI